MLLQAWKDKSSLIWMIAAPIALSFIFGSLMSGQGGDGPPKDDITILVADQDGSTLSKSIIEGIDGHERYVVKPTDDDALRTAVKNRDYNVGVILPQGFETSLTTDKPKKANVVALDISNISMSVMKIAVTRTQQHITAVEAAAMAEEYTNSKDAKQQAFDDMKKRFEVDPPVQVKYTDVTLEEKKTDEALLGINRTFSGFLVMFVMFTLTYAAADILDEKKYRTWDRLLTTPTGKVSIMVGKLAGAYAVGIAQLAILLGFGTLLLGVKLQGNVTGSLVVIAVFMLAITGMGLFLSTMVKTSAQLQGMGAFIIIATSMLGGSFYPVEVVSPTMHAIAKFMPQYWAIRGFTDATVLNASLSALWPSIGILLAFAGVFFALGLARLHYE
jgi:ABC-2 type transport system permease protein